MEAESSEEGTRRIKKEEEAELIRQELVREEVERVAHARAWAFEEEEDI